MMQKLCDLGHITCPLRTAAALPYIRANTPVSWGCCVDLAVPGGEEVCETLNTVPTR